MDQGDTTELVEEALRLLIFPLQVVALSVAR